MGKVAFEEDLVDLARDRQLGLELLDPSLGGGELERLLGARALDLAAVDLLLLQPAIDRGVAHAEDLGELGHFRARSS